MAVDAQHPVDLWWDFLLQFDDGVGQLLHLYLAGVVDDVGARREQHFGLEHEAVADNADVLPVGQDLAQPAEEIGAVAVQFLHTLGQRDVQAAAEIGDLGVGVAVALLGDVERVLERADLLAQRGDLLVEDLHLAQGLLADLALVVEFARKRGRALVGGVAGAGALRQQLLEPALLRLGSRQRRLQVGKRILLVLRVGSLQRQQLGQFVDLRVEAIENRVLAGDLAAEKELRQHEDGEQEHDGQEQRRQRVDEARPVVNAPVGAPPCQRHVNAPRASSARRRSSPACCASPAARRTAPRPSRA